MIGIWSSTSRTEKMDSMTNGECSHFFFRGTSPYDKVAIALTYADGQGFIREGDAL